MSQGEDTRVCLRSASPASTASWQRSEPNTLSHLGVVKTQKTDKSATHMKRSSDSRRTRTSRRRWIRAISTSISSGSMVLSAIDTSEWPGRKYRAKMNKGWEKNTKDGMRTGDIKSRADWDKQTSNTVVVLFFSTRTALLQTDKGSLRVDLT